MTSASLPLDPVARGTTMLPLPGRQLTDGQEQGTECPWCGTAVTPADSIDLGERPRRDADRIHPRGCPPCVHAAARHVYKIHSRSCPTCERDPTACGTRRILRRLAMEPHR
jgi:hypothetical protein